MRGQRRMQAGSKSSGATCRTQVYSVRFAAAGAAAASSYMEHMFSARVLCRCVMCYYRLQ